jgi:hypothetical protein
MNICGRDYPTIDERHTLWIKREMDGKLDMEFLKSIWIGNPPEPEKPLKFWNDMFFNVTGIMR